MTPVPLEVRLRNDFLEIRKDWLRSKLNELLGLLLEEVSAAASAVTDDGESDLIWSTESLGIIDLWAGEPLGLLWSDEVSEKRSQFDQSSIGLLQSAKRTA